MRTREEDTAELIKVAATAMTSALARLVADAVRDLGGTAELEQLRAEVKRLKGVTVVQTVEGRELRQTIGTQAAEIGLLRGELEAFRNTAQTARIRIAEFERDIGLRDDEISDLIMVRAELLADRGRP